MKKRLKRRRRNEAKGGKGGVTFEKTGEETSRERGKDKTRKIKM